MNDTPKRQPMKGRKPLGEKGGRRTPPFRAEGRGPASASFGPRSPRSAYSPRPYIGRNEGPRPHRSDTTGRTPFHGRSPRLGMETPERRPFLKRSSNTSPASERRPSFAPKKRFVPQKPPRTRKASFPGKEASASWENVAAWYHEHLTRPDTYHQQVLLPNLLRLVDPKPGEAILDLACGEGFFTRAFHEKGARVTGVDIGGSLIEIARKTSPDIPYHVASGAALPMIASGSIQKITIILAIQNIEHILPVFVEAARILAPHGNMSLVMNHPAFRVPKSTSWEYDEKKKTQYRRVDAYLSESRSAMDMHPGIPGSEKTLSFHRPLQYYVKALTKAGFVIEHLEEWISHKASDSGPRARAENVARKEIPLFLYLSAKKQ